MNEVIPISSEAPQLIVRGVKDMLLVVPVGTQMEIKDCESVVVYLDAPRWFQLIKWWKLIRRIARIRGQLQLWGREVEK